MRVAVTGGRGGGCKEHSMGFGAVDERSHRDRDRESLAGHEGGDRSLG